MNLFGLIFVNIFFAGIWTVLGICIDKMGVIFNQTIQLMPTMQDFVNGFSMMQTVWVALPIVVFLFTCFDYIMTQNSISSGEV
jgi:hypothetical protein